MARLLAIGPINCSIEKERRVQVLVRDNNVDQALRVLKKKMQREGVFREMKLRRHYEKPSERRVREKAEAVRRARKLCRSPSFWKSMQGPKGACVSLMATFPDCLTARFPD